MDTGLQIVAAKPIARAGLDPRLVLVVDDDESLLSAVRRVLTAAGYTPDIYASGAALFARAPIERAACIILDAAMPQASGLQVQAQLKLLGFRTPVIFLSGTLEIPVAVAAMRAGAVDFIEKPFDNADLVARIRRAIEQHGHAQIDDIERRDVRRKLATLTPREVHVLQIMITGKTSKEIARSMGGSHRTIEVHRRHVMEKMGAETLADLVRMHWLVGAQAQS